MFYYVNDFTRAGGVPALAMGIGKLGWDWCPFKKRIKGKNLGRCFFNVACYISAATNCIYSALCEELYILTLLARAI